MTPCSINCYYVKSPLQAACGPAQTAALQPATPPRLSLPLKPPYSRMMCLYAPRYHLLTRLVASPATHACSVAPESATTRRTFRHARNCIPISLFSKLPRITYVENTKRKLHYVKFHFMDTGRTGARGNVRRLAGARPAKPSRRLRARTPPPQGRASITSGLCHLDDVQSCEC